MASVSEVEPPEPYVRPFWGRLRAVELDCEGNIHLAIGGCRIAEAVVRALRQTYNGGQLVVFKVSRFKPHPPR